MPYAANNRVSKSPIEGGVEITESQYREGVEAMLNGKVVSIDGGFHIEEQPISTEYWTEDGIRHLTEHGEAPPDGAALEPPPSVDHFLRNGEWVTKTTYWLDVDDQRETAPGEAIPDGATTEPPPDGNHDLVDGAWVENAARVEVQCLRQIDAKASEVRGRFITSGTGQSAVYLTKYEEARAYKAASSPVNSDYPYLDKEAGRRGMTVIDLADEVIATRNAWTDPVGATIEAERVGGKADVRAASTIANKEAARDGAVTILDGITP